MSESFQHRKLELDDLRTTSESLWGNPVYGDVANNWLRTHIQRDSFGRVRSAPEGQLAVQMGYNTEIKIIPGKEYIGKAARQLMPLSPYLLTCRPAEDFNVDLVPHVRFFIEPEELATRQLATYIRGHRYDSHIFHGSYGKALDVLGVASDVVTASDIDPTRYDGQFISFDNLKEIFATSPTTEFQQRDTLVKIRNAARTQAHNGTVHEYGEIIFEGFVDPNSYPSSWEQVAYTSLVAIAERCRPENPMADFLRQRFATAETS